MSTLVATPVNTPIPEPIPTHPYTLTTVRLHRGTGRSGGTALHLVQCHGTLVRAFDARHLAEARALVAAHNAGQEVE